MKKTYTFQDPKGRRDVSIEVERIGNEVNVVWKGDEPSDEAKEEAKRRFKAEFGDQPQP